MLTELVDLPGGSFQMVVVDDAVHDAPPRPTAPPATFSLDVHPRTRTFKCTRS
jgi:formylglycine-generating enzyme required for sulfatase activity